MTTQRAEATTLPRLAAAWARRYRWLARREILACVVILVLTLGLRAALLPWLSIPQASVHDEFSYLLAADTYAHGRLANPPHKFWQHFETFHVLQQPTYASKYQPLQGLVLALGQTFSQPWWGVYLSSGLMCAAICWMLQGWITPELALFGALLCALRVGVLSYWMNSYFGGAVPGIGGALAFGAVIRIWRRKQFGHSITWGLGLAILVLSRPYDAAVAACATAVLLLWFLRKSPIPLRTIRWRVCLPVSIVVLICMAAVGYNDFRVTGHPLILPFQMHDRQYAVASMFTMVPLRPQPSYRHAVMGEFWAGWNVGQWRKAKANPFLHHLATFYVFVNFFFPFCAVLLPFLFYPFDLDTVEEGATVFLLLVFVLMILLLIAALPHYAAAFASIFYLRFLQSLQRLLSWRPWGRPVGRVLGLLLVGALSVELVSNLFGLVSHGEDAFSRTLGRDTVTQSFALDGSRFKAARRSIIQDLGKQTGQQLVLVRYAAEHNPQYEWVYNGADIDGSPIVWAREMSTTDDLPFLQYFHNRRIWLLEPDLSPPRLSPYSRMEQR